MEMIALHLGMSIAMWIVLAAVGLLALVRIVRGLQGGFSVDTLSDAVVKPMLMDILPLIILAWLTRIDPSHIILLIWYYVAAVLIILRTVQKLASELPHR